MPIGWSINRSPYAVDLPINHPTCFLLVHIVRAIRALSVLLVAASFAVQTTSDAPLLAISSELKSSISYLLPHNSPLRWRFPKYQLNTTSQLILTYPTRCAIMTAYIPMPNGINPHIVHPNELHRAKPTKIEYAATNPTDWVIWISLPILSRRTTTFNLSLSSSRIWDSCFFTHFRGFNLVSFDATNSTCSVSVRAIWYLPSVTSSEISTDIEPTGDDGVTSISTHCDTSFVVNLSTYREMVDFKNDVSSNMTCLL